LRRLETDAAGTTVGEITFREETVLLPGDRFILRRPAPVDTIGGGVVLDAHPAGSRAGAPAPSSGDEAWLAQGALAGAAGKSVEGVGAELGVPPDEVERRVASLASARRLVRAGALLFDAETWSRLGTRIAGELAAFHASEPLRPGMPREAL